MTIIFPARHIQSRYLFHPFFQLIIVFHRQRGLDSFLAKHARFFVCYLLKFFSRGTRYPWGYIS